MQTEFEHRCPTCKAVVNPDLATCKMCGAPLSHTVIRSVTREPIFPEPMLVRHADATTAFAMDPTAHMYANCAPADSHDIPAVAQSRTADEKGDAEVTCCARYLIVGGGVAGLSAAEEVRARDPHAEVTIACAEPYPPYRRPLLANQLQECQAEIAAFLRDDAALREARIQVKTNCPITRIDPAAHTAWSDDEMFSYDKCILALGSAPRTPDFDGTTLPCVHTLQTLRDGQALLEALDSPQAVSVIGGGLCGVAIAITLAKAGHDVSLFEKEHTLLPRLLHRTTAAELLRHLRGMGISVYHDARVCALTAAPGGANVLAENGKRVSANTVVLTVGRLPVTPPAGLPLDWNGGILTDGCMQTTVCDIYACGDCVRSREGVALNGWQFAVESGKVAGACAAGETEPLHAHPHPIVLALDDVSLCIVGDCGRDMAKTYHVVSYGATDRRAFAEYFFLEDRLVGAATIAHKPSYALLTDAVARKLTSADFFATHAFCAVSETTLV